MSSFFSLASYNLIVFSCGLIVIIVGYTKLWKIRKTEKPEVVGIFSIWLIGIIGFLLGIFGQILIMIDAFDSISMVGDISPAIVAEKIKSSYKSTLIGLAVLIISLVIWGILKGAKQKRIALKNFNTK